MSVRALARRSSSPGRAFESMYRRHAGDVYRYALAMLDRQADAEDATQTTFMNAYRALERGERPREEGSWLRAIALNVCREHHRRAGRRPDEVPLNDDPGDLVLEPPGPEIGDVIRGLAHLPFNQRAALVMREFEGRSLTEIAASLEVSASAVEALLFRARRALREQLEGTLSCAEAERAISAQLDGALPRGERGPLRAHLRECEDCASLARRLRGQRAAIKSLAAIPLPATLAFGRLALPGQGASSAIATAYASAGAGASGATGSSSLLAAVGGSVATKAAVAAVAGVAALGLGYAALHRSSRPVGATRLASTAARRPHSTDAVTTSAGRGASGNTAGAAAPVANASIKTRSTTAARAGHTNRGFASAQAVGRRPGGPSNGPSAATGRGHSAATATTGTGGANSHGSGAEGSHGASSTAPGHTKTKARKQHAPATARTHTTHTRAPTKSHGQGKGHSKGSTATTTTTTTAATTTTAPNGNGKGKGRGNKS